jgi:hypothetical protein
MLKNESFNWQQNASQGNTRLGSSSLWRGPGCPPNYPDSIRPLSGSEEPLWRLQGPCRLVLGVDFMGRTKGTTPLRHVE